MFKYIIIRLLGLIPLIMGAMFIVFMLLHLWGLNRLAFSFTPLPPEVIWEWREMHGLNDPVLIQYIRYMANAFTGDFGMSLRNNVSITEEVMQRLPNTLILASAALTSALLLAVPLGIIAAIKRNTWIDGLSMFIALIGIAMPAFWLGLLLVLFFSIRLDWFPPSGANEWNSIFLPAIALGTGMMAAMIHSIRLSMLEIMKKDYIRTARAKGLTGGKIIRKHVLRNALVPILEAFKTHLGTFLVSLLIIEIVFAWPGIGRLFIQGKFAQDYPMVLGSMLIFIILFAIMKLLVDIVQIFLDPRVKEQRI